MHCSRLKWFVALALLLFSYAPARAGQFEVGGTSTSRVTDVNPIPIAVNDAHNFDNTTAASVVTPTTVNSSAAMAFGSANATVTASEGLFKGFATSTYADTGFNENAQTDARAFATDNVTVTSGSLPLNTPVTLSFNLHVSGTLTAPNVTAGGLYENFATASFHIDQFGGNQSLALSYRSDNAFSNVFSGSFTGFVGELLTLSQSMELTTYVSGDYLFAHPSVSTVDFSNTVQFFGDSLTPGASLTADSLHDYASTPEPSSVVLGLFAAAGFGAIAIRKLKARRAGFSC